MNASPQLKMDLRTALYNYGRTFGLTKEQVRKIAHELGISEVNMPPVRKVRQAIQERTHNSNVGVPGD